MRTITYVVLLLTSIIIGNSLASADQVYSGPWGPATNGVQMSIDLDTDAATNRPNFVFPMEDARSPQEITTNEAVVILRVRLRNLTTNLTFYYDMHWFDVKLPSGMEVSTKPKPKRPTKSTGGFVEPPPRSHAAFYDLGPGQVQELNSQLNGVCSFNDIGVYRISGIVTFAPSGRTAARAECVSKPLEIIVTPNPWAARRGGGASGH